MALDLRLKCYALADDGGVAYAVFRAQSWAGLMIDWRLLMQHITLLYATDVDPKRTQRPIQLDTGIVADIMAD